MPATAVVASLRVMARRCEACTTTAAGVATLAAGIGLIGVGLWARRDVRWGIERERVTAASTPLAPRGLLAPSDPRQLAAGETHGGPS